MAMPVAGFQKRTVLSAPQEARVRPLGAKVTPVTGPAWPAREKSCLPSAVFQSLTVPSLPAPASFVPSGLRLTALTASAWANSRRELLVGMSKSLTVLSAPPEARVVLRRGVTLKGRLLGPENYGDYAVALGAAAICASFANFGSSETLPKFYPAYVESGRFGLASGFLRTTFIAAIIVSLIGAVLNAVYYQTIQIVTFGHPVAIIWVIVPVMVINGYLFNLLVAVESELPIMAPVRVSGPWSPSITLAMPKSRILTVTPSGAVLARKMLLGLRSRWTIWRR